MSAINREAVLNTLDNMDKALDENRTVEAYKDLLKECFKELPPVEPQEWVSVKKHGNPTRSDEYWVTVRHMTFESVERDYYSTTFGSWESGNEIIAWREIEPSPYKEINMTHEIKILESFADAVLSGEKTFEIRYNDRGYQKGDLIKFKVVDNCFLLGIPHPLNDKQYEITYVISSCDWGGLKDNYVVFSIREVGDNQ